MRIRAPMLAVVVLGLCALPQSTEARHTTADLEYRIKAHFVERLTRFVDWPEEALPPHEPFVVGVLGDSPIRTHLAQVADGRPFKQHATTVRSLTRISQAPRCHLLFISSEQARELPKLLESIHGAAVLTVADSPGFAHRGVHINLFLERGRLRFEINLHAVHHSGLHIRSKLLKLARFVGPGAVP